MEGFLIGSAVFLSFLVLLSLGRALFGPAIFTRIVAINVIGTKTVVILALIGLIKGRMDMFVDISLAYGLLNFIGTLAAAKYLESKESKEATQ